MKIKATAMLLAAVFTVAPLTGCADKGGATTTTVTESTTTTVSEQATTKADVTTKKDVTTTAKTNGTTVTSVTDSPTQTTAKTDKTKKTDKTDKVDTVETVATTTKAATTTSRRTVTRPPTTTTAKSTFGTTTTTANKVNIQYPVDPPVSVDVAAKALTNQGYQTEPIAKEFVRVAPYDPEHAFTHQQGMAMFKGKLYVIFSRGYAHEDFPGQEMVVVSSENFYNWSEPQVIGHCRQGTYDKTTIITGSLYNRGDRLFAYFAEHDWGKSKFTENGFDHNQPSAGTVSYTWVTSTEDGVNWSEPVPAIGNPHESPRQTLTGEWLASWGDGMLFSDKQTPSGTDWMRVGLTEPQRQFGYAQGARMLGECSWYQLDNGVINMVMRNDMRLDGQQIFNAFLSQSYDGGRTWTDPYRCENFRIDWQMVNFGRLPDGRFYFIGTTALNQYVGRYPLILLLSDDGYNFTRGYTLRDEIHNLQQSGWSKGGEYGYPEVLIHGDYLYVVTSRVKEVVEVTRVKLSDIK